MGIGEDSVISNRWRYFLNVQGREVELAEGEASLGRSQSANVSVKDASVSRNHALILARNGRLTVKDLNSSNGTFLNGMRIFAEAELHDGDALTLGESEMRVRILPPESVAATMRIDPRALLAGEELRLQAEEEAKAALLPKAAPARDPLPPPPSAVMPASRPSFAPPPPPAAPPLPRTPAPMPALAPQAPPPAPPRMPAPAPALPADPTVHETGPTPLPARPAPAVAPPPLPASPPPAAVAIAPGPDQAVEDEAFALPDLDLPPLPPVEEMPKAPALRATLPGTVPRPGVIMASKPAGFWIRTLAVLLDSLLLGLLCGGIFLATGNVLDDEQRVQLVGVVWIGLDLLMRLLGWSIWGTTPGKRLLGLYVFPAGSSVPGLGFGKGILRCVGYWVSGATAGIGFLLVAFTKGKRGLHDMIAGTTVGRTTRGA